MRAAIRAILSKDPSLEIVGEAEDGLRALTLCRELRPDLVLMDVSMPVLDGIEVTRKIKAEFPLTGVLVLTAHEDEGLMLKAVRAGAAGYVLKGDSLVHLVGAVREALAGESPMDPRLAGRLLRRLAREEEATPNWPPPQATARHEEPKGSTLPSLTARELEVVRHLVAGAPNRRIAQELYVSLSTVKRHLERINTKLGVSDRTQAAVKVIELGILPERSNR
jgi:DNA-binding NarL/FixJ family response regulator